MWSVFSKKNIDKKNAIFIFLNKKWARFFVLTLLVGFFYWISYKSLKDFSVPPVEIRNECKSDKNSFICERKFDVPTYAEEFKKSIEEISRIQTIPEKLAGGLPVFFRYSIGFQDNSSRYFWIKQHRIPIPPLKEYRKGCRFPQNFEERENGGTYKNNFAMADVPNKVQELATSLNDCSQAAVTIFEKIDQVETAEKYKILVTLTWFGHLSVGVLALSLTSLILGIFKIIVKFYKIGF